MGLAASQGRLLSLTARMSDLVYEAQQISQQRLKLAEQQQQMATAYTDAMNNKIMKATTPDNNTQLLTFDVLTSQDPFTGLGMRIVDSNGNVVVPGNIASIDIEDEEGKKSSYNLSNATEFINKYMPGLSGEALSEANQMNMSELFDYYNANFASSNQNLKVSYNEPYAYLKNENERYCFDENITKSDYLHNMLLSGEYTVEKFHPETGWDKHIWQGSVELTEEYDTSDDAAAESQYESDMLAAQKRDKMLELRLEQIQTEENAVQTDLDSAKSVIEKNIEGSFKTFA